MPSARTTGAAERNGLRWLGRYDYATGARLFEFASLVVFGAASVVLLRRVVGAALDRAPGTVAVQLIAAALLAFVVSDLLSGIVHFLCDNFGTPDTPLVGQKFIKSFRDHHDDPMAMTAGDWVTVNADNTTACLPVLVPCAIWLDAREHFAISVFICALIIFVTITNQAHKWAHMPRVPRLVGWLQRRGVLLSTSRHDVHHTAPFDSYFCITSGVLNPLLERAQLWRRLLVLFGHAPAS